MSDENDALGVRIGAREIYDQLIGMRGDVQGLVRSEQATQAKLEDHETRLRSVEHWKYATGTSLITAVSAIVVALIRP